MELYIQDLTLFIITEAIKTLGNTSYLDDENNNERREISGATHRNRATGIRGAFCFLRRIGTWREAVCGWVVFQPLQSH